mgnify:CR=1 FL=1
MHSRLMTVRVWTLPLHTVNWNEKFGTEIIYDESLFQNNIFVFHWPSEASKSSEKLEKANKGCEVQINGQYSQMSKFYIFFTHLGSSGINCFENTYGLNIKAIKATKGHMIVKIAISVSWMSNAPNLLSGHSLGSNEVPKYKLGQPYENWQFCIKMMSFEGVKFHNTKKLQKTNNFSLKFLIQIYITAFLISWNFQVSKTYFLV